MPVGEGAEGRRTIVGALAQELALARPADRVDGGRDEAGHSRVCAERERVRSERAKGARGGVGSPRRGARLPE